jgi:hypothetical protein
MNLDSSNSFTELSAKLDEVSSQRREIISIRRFLENEACEVRTHTNAPIDGLPSAVSPSVEPILDIPGGIYSVESDSDQSEPSPTFLLSADSGGLWYRDILRRGTPK